MAARPKVLFVLNRVLGWKTYCEQLSSTLRDRTDVDIHFHYLAPTLAGRLFVKRHRKDGLLAALRRVDPLVAFKGPLGRSVRKEIARIRPDFVHFGPHWPAASVSGLDPSMPFSIALDATHANMNELRAVLLWGEDSIAREAELLRRAELLFPYSHWVERALVRDYGVDRERIQVMQPTVRPAPVLKDWSRPSGKLPKVLFVGNDFLRKGGDRLVSWVQGPLADRCELHIISHDKRAQVSAPNIVCHGGMPNEKWLREIAPDMDLLCHPTRADMSAFVVVEAASVGIPSIASAIGGITDLIRDGETGYLVKSDDDAGFLMALDKLLSSASLRRTMGEASRALALEEFDANRNFNGMLDRILARL